jgi:glutathione S-transferase
MANPTVYHIPVCPFSQRLEILLALKGIRSQIDFQVVDITKPRPSRLQKLMRGTTALPILEIGGRILKESLVILKFLEDSFPTPPVARADAYERAVENMLIAKEAPFTAAGYGLVMNKDLDRRQALHDRMLSQYSALEDFLSEHSPGNIFLFDRFGLAEAVFTPLFMRFWFLEYYEDFHLPDDGRFSRVSRWRDACVAHPAAQQVSREEIIKLYYDYAKGSGNGALVAGRSRSSFVFEPSWRDRPWPPANKYSSSASDQELGLV